MYHPKYSLFFDNHTHHACPDVGAAFDAQAYADEFVRCRVDFVTFHARCNQGFAYYPTEIGLRHPSLSYDLFGALAEACTRRGIAISAYFNGGISSEEGLLHRDWTTLLPDGRTHRDPPLTPYVRTMCYNSPYRDHLIAMIREVAQRYPVSGFFVDCLASFPCVCRYCMEEMRAKGIDWRDEAAVTDFSAFSAIRLSEEIATAVRAILPSPLLFFNGPGYREQAHAATYFDLECLPNNLDWGYRYVPLMARHLNTFTDRPTLNMTGRFYDWGDFGGLRPQAALEYDLLYGLILGLRPNIGCHFHPRGTINRPMFDRVAATYDFLRRYEPWWDEAQPLTEIAILFPKGTIAIQRSPELYGCVRMLSELKHPFSIIDTASDWSPYRLLILPDSVTLDEPLAQRIKRYLAEGGAILSSARSGLNREESALALPEEWGVEHLGESEHQPAFFEPAPAFARQLPAMPLALYTGGLAVRALPGTTIGATLTRPYYNHQWDGTHAFYYIPPDAPTQEPLLTLHGRVAHLTHPLFTVYEEKVASVELRQLVSNAIDALLPDPLLRVSDAPSFLKTTVTHQPGRRIVHLLAYVPELRGKSEMVEEPIHIAGCRVALRRGEGSCTVSLAPEGRPLPFEEAGGYLVVNVPPFRGYAMLIFTESASTGSKISSTQSKPLSSSSDKVESGTPPPLS